MIPIHQTTSQVYEDAATSAFSFLARSVAAQQQPIITTQQSGSMSTIPVTSRSNTSSTSAGYPCEVCGRVLTAPHSLRRHMFIHSDSRPFQCSICKKSYRKKSMMKYCMERHERGKPYECEICGHISKMRNTYLVHLTKAHNIYYKRWEYSKAKGAEPTGSIRNIILEETTDYHMPETRDIRINTCTVCGENYKTKTAFLDCIDRHKHGDRDYICDFCGKAFKFRSLLSKHFNKVHKSGFDALNAEQATTSFTELTVMPAPTIDSATPSNVKCHICNLSYNYAWEVANCTERHFRGRPYTCVTCDQSFELKHFYHFHLQAVHKIKNVNTTIEL